jgi:hypothetical protein
MFAILAATAIAALSWGSYGPTLHQSTHELHSRLVPFVCVGLAYFLMAVLVPMAIMAVRPEPGTWTKGGVLWSLLAGTLGAAGALFVILALNRGGPASAIFVMPLVFGGAPVVNTVFSMLVGKTYKQVGVRFFAGLVAVVAGAVMVLLYRPTAPSLAAPLPAETIQAVAIFAGLAALCWGSYGPMVHWGQDRMGKSRLRPFVCVGMAYFLVAVLFPLGLLQAGVEQGATSTTSGYAWGLAAGALGAMGAMGVIMAFASGGKPIYVMPLIFGGAPVINTFISMTLSAPGVSPAWPFYIGLALVVAGAATVLIFAPRPAHGPKPAAPPATNSDQAKPADAPMGVR